MKKLTVVFLLWYPDISVSFFLQTQPMPSFLSPAERTKIIVEMDNGFEVVSLPKANLNLAHGTTERKSISFYCNCNPIKIIFRGTWVILSTKWQTLCFGSGRDPRGMISRS